MFMKKKREGEGGMDEAIINSQAVESSAARTREASSVYDELSAKLDALGEEDSEIRYGLELLAEPGLDEESRAMALEMFTAQSARAAELYKAMEEVGKMIETSIEEQGPVIDEAKLAWARAEAFARDARLAQESAAERLDEIRALLSDKKEKAKLVVTQEARDVVEEVFQSDPRIPRDLRSVFEKRAQRALNAKVGYEKVIDLLAKEASDDIDGIGRRRAHTDISWRVA